jgi:hypothetical protein
VDAFLKTAAGLGLSKGQEEAWRQEYDVLEGAEDAADLFVTESHYFRNAAESGELPRCSPTDDDPEQIVCPAIFRGDRALLTPRAQWPAYPDPTRERLERVQKERSAKGQAPLHPIHWYGYAVIYPVDRARKTPLTRRTLLDVMREALGTAPCDLSWLEALNDGK